MKAAIDLETEVATQESIYKTFAYDHMAREPKLFLETDPAEPPAPMKKEYGDASRPTLDLQSILYIAGVFGVLIGAFLLFSSLLTGIIVITVSVCACIPFKQKEKAISDENKRNEAAYKDALEMHRQAVEQTRMRNEEAVRDFNSNHALWEANGRENSDVLHGHIEQTAALLKKVYEKDLIYPKYHNLPALTSIYEYMVTERCNELAGPHGAYNLYEDEVRKDTVISQLNTVIENLEKIKQNQYMLYQQAKRIADSSNEIRNELSCIRGCTVQLVQLSALNAYYSALTETNTRISATFHILNG